MICTKCGTQYPDGMVYCMSCGIPLSEEAPKQEPNPMQNSNAPQAKGGSNKKVLFIVLGGVALLLIAVGIVVALVTCSANAKKPQLDNLIKGGSSEIINAIDGFDTTKHYNSVYYTPSDMKETFRAAANAFENGNAESLDKNIEDIKKQSPWALGFYEEEASGDLGNLSRRDIEGKGQPIEGVYVTYRTLDAPTPEDVLKIAREVTAIDSVKIGNEPTKKGREQYGSLTYCYGWGKDADMDVCIRCEKLGDVYEITVYVYDSGRISGDIPDRFIDGFQTKFDAFFGDEYTYSK